MNLVFRSIFLFLLLAAAVSCQRDKTTSNEIVNPELGASPDDAQLRQINAAIEKDPGVAANYSTRARLLLEQQKLDQALTDIDKAISLDSTRGDFYYLKARVLRGQKQVPTALKTALKAERKGFADTDLFMSIGEMYLIIKQYQKAIDYLNKSLQQSQFNEQAYFYKGLVYAETGDTTRAISSLQTAVEMEPQYVDAYNALFKLHYAKNDQKMAEQYISSGLRFAPEDPYLWYNQGLLFRSANRSDTAQASFQRALLLDSTFYLAQYNLGTLAYEQEKYPEAIAYLERAQKKDKTLPGIEALLGFSYEQTGNFAEAKRYYEAADAKQSNDPEVQKGLARVSAKLAAPAATRKN